MKFTNSEKYKENSILKGTFEFAVDIIKFSEILEQEKKIVIVKQLIRSGTSIGANAKRHKMQKAKQISFIR